MDINFGNVLSTASNANVASEPVLTNAISPISNNVYLESAAVVSATESPLQVDLIFAVSTYSDTSSASYKILKRISLDREDLINCAIATKPLQVTEHAEEAVRVSKLMKTFEQEEKLRRSTGLSAKPGTRRFCVKIKQGNMVTEHVVGGVRCEAHARNIIEKDYQIKQSDIISATFIKEE